MLKTNFLKILSSLLFGIFSQNQLTVNATAFEWLKNVFANEQISLANNYVEKMVEMGKQKLDLVEMSNYLVDYAHLTGKIFQNIL